MLFSLSRNLDDVLPIAPGMPWQNSQEIILFHIDCIISLWLDFMAYQPLKVIERQIHFYENSQFYFKQFSFA